MNLPWPWNQLYFALTEKWAWLFYVSTLACGAFAIMALIQFIKCLRTKNTTSLSIFYTVILPITNTCITIYDLILFFNVLGADDPEHAGIAIFNWSLLMPACINGLFSAYGTMILKVKHVIAAKKLKISEYDYYIKYLKPKAYTTRKAKAQKKGQNHKKSHLK